MYQNYSRSNSVGRVIVYRKDGTRFHPDHVQAVDRSGRVSVPVWGFFTGENGGKLVQIEGKLTAVKYIALLENHLWPFIQREFPDRPVRFIQDKSPIHTARIVNTWFEGHPQIQLLPWPPKGADLNAIENLWADMVRDMGGPFHGIKKDELFAKAKESFKWLMRRPRYTYKLAASMQTRLSELREARGHWTRY